jgi:hypothetical protein
MEDLPKWNGTKYVLPRKSGLRATKQAIASYRNEQPNTAPDNPQVR